MLRVRLCRREALPVARFAAFAIPELPRPVLAGVFGDEIIATTGVCPHEDVALDPDALDGTQLTCPGHGYQFDIRSGACRHDPALHLRRYTTTVAGGEVWIDLV